MVLGVHCPIRDGFAAALRYAQSLGCGVMQIFPYRRYEVPGARELEDFRRARQANRLRLLVHSRFAPCLASSVAPRRRRSIELLEQELRLAAAMGAEALILHAGAYSEAGDRQEGLRLAATSIIEALERCGEGLPVYVENVPGGGRRLGGTLEDVAFLIESVRRAGRPCGACIDTAHAWAAGFEIASAAGMLGFVAGLSRIVGAGNVGAFHINDTRALPGSHRESHAPWGEGVLGTAGLRALLTRPEYADRPAIVELPLGVGADAAKESLAFARRLMPALRS